MAAEGGDEGLNYRALFDAVTDSAYAGATALETSQHFEDLLKAVDGAIEGQRIIDPDILARIRKRRDEYVMDCLPQALTFLRDVQNFGIEFDRVITDVTQRLQDPNSTDWGAPLRNLGRDVDTITRQAQTLHDALRALHGRLEGDENALASAMKPDPNPDLKRKLLAGIVGAGLAAAIAVGIGLALATGGATYIVASGVFGVAAGKAVVGAAGAGICAGLVGGGAIAWYCKSVKDAKAKLMEIQRQIRYVMSDVADLIGKWKEINASIQRVERRLGYEVGRDDILFQLRQLKEKWHNEVIVPAQRLAVQE